MTSIRTLSRLVPLAAAILIAGTAFAQSNPGDTDPNTDRYQDRDPAHRNVPAAPAPNPSGDPDSPGDMSDREKNTDPKHDRMKQRGAGARHDDMDRKNASNSYVVKKGDTLGTIAKSELGSEKRWKDIARANDIDDPDDLEVGKRLQLPERDSKQGNPDRDRNRSTQSREE